MVKRIELHGRYTEQFGKYALVDDCDYERVNAYCWHMTDQGYARAKVNGKLVLLHRLVMNCNPDSPRVDHKDLDKLNNQRSNLRFVTHSQNRMNTPVMRHSGTQVKGVNKYKNRWRASIQTGVKRLHLGSFQTIRSAAKAYNEAAVKYFGEYALLNDLSQLPPEEDPPVKPPKSSRFRGVSLHKGKWCAECEIPGKKYHLGRFDSEEAAARARDAFVKANNLKRPLNFRD